MRNTPPNLDASLILRAFACELDGQVEVALDIPTGAAVVRDLWGHMDLGSIESTMFSIRAAYVAMLTQDTLGVLAASADLERLSTIAPNTLWYCDLRTVA